MTSPIDPDCRDPHKHRTAGGPCGCPCHLLADEAFAESVRSGLLWLPFDEFHARAEQLIGRPIFTHEFAHPAMVQALRDALDGCPVNLPADSQPLTSPAGAGPSPAELRGG